MNEILQAFQSYQEKYGSEAKWLSLLRSRIEQYNSSKQGAEWQNVESIRKRYEVNNGNHGDAGVSASIDEDINQLKSTFDPLAVSLTLEA